MTQSARGRAIGRLLVFEGPEGAGKTTQLARVAEWFRGEGHVVSVFREPGGTPLGDDIRRLLLDPRGAMTAESEALLFMASRAELVAREVRPALARGDFVLLDRFFLSTYAYQIYGRGLSEAHVRSANQLATGGLVPDLTVLLDVPPTTGLRRAKDRGPADRMERSDNAFHERVSRAFSAFAAGDWQRQHPECGRIVRIDGEGSVDEVFERIVTVIRANGAIFPAQMQGAAG